MLVVLLSFILAISINIPESVAKETGKQITIIFKHDMHDHFLPVKDEQDGVLVELGGYDRLQSAILTQKKNNTGALLLDAGDFSMGTPFQTIFKSNSPELRMLGKMGYARGGF